MNNYPTRSACVANGMTFETWKHRPAYKVHCLTFDLARKLCGVERINKLGTGMASLMTVPGADGLFTFRSLAPYREPTAIALRKRVATRLREMRRERHLMV